MPIRFLVLALALCVAVPAGAAGAPAFPWAAGDTPVPPWRIDSIEGHPEYVRLSFRSDVAVAEVEIVAATGAADPFATRLYRVQPAPGGRAEPGLLLRLRDELARVEAAPGHQPFVRRLERTTGSAAGDAGPKAGGGRPEAGRGPEADPAVIDRRARLLQAGWLALLLAAFPLAALAGRAAGAGAGKTVAVVALAAVAGTCLVRARPRVPLHPNGHAWREARELLAPFGGADLGRGFNPYLHGHGGVALQWLGMPRPAGLAPGDAGAAGDPMDASTVPAGLACASAALLAIVVSGRAWAGAAAAGLTALHPLLLLLGGSGNTLSVAAFVLPLSLALLVAARTSGDPLLLAGAGLSALLATSSHSAALLWPPALAAAWMVLRPPERDGRWSKGIAAALGLAVLAEWSTRLRSVLALVSDKVAGWSPDPAGGLDGIFELLPREVLYLAPAWSPVIVPILGLVALAGTRQDDATRRARAVALAIGVGCLPFLAVHACLSDLQRYQGALAGLVCALGAAGVAAASRRFGGFVAAPILALCLVTVPPVAALPVEPDALEDRFLRDALPSLPPGTLVELPLPVPGSSVRTDFPDYLLPAGVRVGWWGDPASARHAGPRVVYLGLACVSWPRLGQDGRRPGGPPGGYQPACLALLGDADPWRTTRLSEADVPRRPDGSVWTYHALSTGLRTGLFAPRPPGGRPGYRGPGASASADAGAPGPTGAPAPGR